MTRCPKRRLAPKVRERLIDAAPLEMMEAELAQNGALLLPGGPNDDKRLVEIGGDHAEDIPPGSCSSVLPAI